MKSLFWKVYQASPQQVYRYFANGRRAARAKDFIERYLKQNTIRKLHVGCGENYIDTWLNTDLVTDNKNIVSLDASKRFPIPADSFDYVYSEHLFEHLNLQQQLNFLRESFRILRPGGKIRIATPDFDFLAHLASNSSKSDFEKEYLAWNFSTFLKNVPEKALNTKDQNVYVINNYFRDWGHQLIHSKSTLRDLIIFCGFQIVANETVGHSSDPVLNGLERHGEMITDKYNRYETMIFEAVKPIGEKEMDGAKE